MVSGWQNAACFSNHSMFISSVFVAVCCASTSFFDNWKSCGELLLFVKVYVWDFQVLGYSSWRLPSSLSSFQGRQMSIYIFGAKGRDHMLYNHCFPRTWTSGSRASHPGCFRKWRCYPTPPPPSQHEKRRKIGKKLSGVLSAASRPSYIHTGSQADRQTGRQADR